MNKRSLAAVGFSSAERWPQADLIQLLAREPSEIHTCTQGEYRLWRSPEGAEAWVHVLQKPPEAGRPPSDTGHMAIVGLTPFHRSESVARVTVKGVLALDRGDPMAGAFVCQLASLLDGDPELLVVVEMVPFALTLRTSFPFTAFVELAGLASEATIYNSLAEYFTKISSPRLLAPGAVAPLPGACETDPAGPGRGGDDGHTTALVTGEIVELQPLCNGLTGHAYWRLVVATERGRIDVFASQAALRGQPATGRLVQAKVQMVGRTTNHAESRGQDIGSAPRAEPSAIDGDGVTDVPRRRSAGGRGG